MATLSNAELRENLEICMMNTLCELTSKENIGKETKDEMKALSKLYTYWEVCLCDLTKDEIDKIICDIEDCHCIVK